MRDYAKVTPAFWTKGPGKRLRGDHEAQLLGLYLITSEVGNMIGLYYIPLATIAHHMAMTHEGALEALARASEADLVHYDEEAELVWIPNAAEIQVAPCLASNDNRRVGIKKDLLAFGKHRFVKDFYDRYGDCYHLDRPTWCGEALRRPFEGPSEALRSQEQDQDQDQEQDQDHPQPPEGGAGASSETRLVPPSRGPWLPKSEAKLWGEDWIAKYEQAMATVAGRPWSFDRKQLAVLEQVVATFCTDKRRIAGWIALAATEFFKATRNDEARLWSSHQPRGMLRWFNEDRPGWHGRRRPTRPEGPRPPAAPAAKPTMSAEETAAAAADLQKLLGGFGGMS